MDRNKTPEEESVKEKRLDEVENMNLKIGWGTGEVAAVE